MGFERLRLTSPRWLAKVAAGATIIVAGSSDGRATIRTVDLMIRDPLAPVLLYTAIIAIGAKLVDQAMSRLSQPSVLGELLLGVLIGNLPLLGFHALEPMKVNSTIDALAGLGLIILLFDVGLESTVSQMLNLGATALAVALAGVLASISLGWGVGALLLAHEPASVHLVLGAAICSTSVGISARVLRDLGRAQSAEARLILAAALIDDVLGLVVVAVAAGVMSGVVATNISAGSVVSKVAEAVGFVLVVFIPGRYFLPRLFSIFSLTSRLGAPGALLPVALGFCFALSWLASAVGLAPIVGALSAGIILEPLHYQDLEKREERTLHQLIYPVSSLLSPMFFVLVGIRTDLRMVAAPDALVLASALTLAAVLGKQACAVGVFGRGVSRRTVAAGMVPRGEVSLVVANLARSLQSQARPRLGGTIFTAVVVTVLLTTLITPLALKRSFRSKAAERPRG
jgi:Kef-type K+ transport system membrane component KefB